MKEEDLADGRVNEMIGTALGLGFVSPKQFPFFALIFLFCVPFIIRNPMQGLVIFACIYGYFWTLTGNDPSRFFERLRRPKQYIASEPSLDFNQAGIPIPKQSRRAVTTYQVKGKKHDYHHIEKKFQFLTYGQIQLDGKKTGYYLLWKGPQLMFIFAWEVGGYDPSVTHEQALSIVSNCTNALNSLPGDIDFKIYDDIECTCEDYVRMQANLLKFKDHDPLSQEIIKSRARRARALASEGRLLQSRITIYAKYRVSLGGDYATTQSWLDDLLSKTQPLISSFNKTEFDSKAAWEKAILYAYRYAYKKVNSLLSSNAGFGMRVRTLNVDNLWARDYLELHVQPIPEIPQYIVYDETGLHHVINEMGTHSLGVLFEPQRGISPVPRFDRRHLYLPSFERYACFIRLGQMRLFPKDKDSVARGYLRFMLKTLSGTSIPLYDSRVVCELTSDRSGFEMLQLDRIISNSVKREALAAKKQTVDVVAMRRREQAINARDLLEDNNIPYWCSVGIWLTRDSPEQLNQDASELIDQLASNGAIERVENNIEHIWFQTWPFEWEAFLTKPDHRRQKYLSYQALPLVPLVKVKPAQKKGMLVVSKELNTPIYIDIANQKNHTAVIAKSGSGKSILLLEPIFENLAYDNLSVIFDFPRPDGSSTYTVLIPLLEKLGVKAAYHNVRESVMNIIEMPDLRHIKSPKQLRERKQAALQNHVRLLCALVMGLAENPDRETLVISLLTECYDDFHANPEISERYRHAIEGGFGSDDYQKMPILQNFVQYAENWFDDYISKKERSSNLVNDTIDLIMTQLRGVLRTPLGTSINGISSFDTNVSVMVIGLTNVAENLDSLIYAMSGLNVLYRGTLSAKRSLLIIDEGTVLFKFQPFARETGIIPVHGRKWGCNFIVAAQEVGTIMNSCSGNEIFKNLDNIFCGYTDSTASAEMEKLDFRKEILKGYATEASRPSPELSQSYWYLKRDDQHIEVTHPPSELMLALGANDPDEDAARKRVMAHYAHDEIAGIKHFARLYSQAGRQGLPMESIEMEGSYEKVA
ncbi:hypothetical protein [Chroococcus sp. FPU101]|uniref:hypothetical protein n=1 Tax=Chroococcus sp. FPU101 TaxID=1974212 RepID=UPI001A8E9C20|nr:hypothetical protein [Chroococcus sp. FPU101]GFE72154.1 hypothetical protein CFPU101_47640 [Chroococcus sp. FPU101]